MKQLYFLSLLFAMLMSACTGRAADGVESVTAEAFRQELAGPHVYLIDARTPEEYAQGHIAGAHLLDWLNPEAFRTGAEQLDKANTILVYCRSGRRSLEAARYLSSLGYKVVDLHGGIASWQRAGYPLTPH